MAKTGKTNLTQYSSANMTIPKGSDRQTEYASKRVMGKVGSGGQRRAPQYTLESQKK